MLFQTLNVVLLAASATAFSPTLNSPYSRGSVSLNAEMSKSLPFMIRPEKLDGSMPGDVGFDPMGLSEIQPDLNYAREAELKHGRICMLAITGMVVQEAGIHLPGERFTETADPFKAVATVGFIGNLQVFLVIGIIELIYFNKYYDDSTPGDLGWGAKGFEKMIPEKQFRRREVEIVHGRLAMIALTGAVVQTILYHQPLLSVLDFTKIYD